MARPERQSLLPVADGSISQDENAGLAARLIELRAVVEENRVASARACSELKTDVSRISDRLTAALAKVDQAMSSWESRTRVLDQSLRESAEQVRASGEIARGMKDRMKVLDELRETQADPHELLKPYRRQLSQLEADLTNLRKVIDVRFEGLPRPKATPAETRDDPGEIGRLRVEVKRLANLVLPLEGR